VLLLVLLVLLASVSAEVEGAPAAVSGAWVRSSSRHFRSLSLSLLDDVAQAAAANMFLYRCFSFTLCALSCLFNHHTPTIYIYYPRPIGT
jgi:hypothetical protein